LLGLFLLAAEVFQQAGAGRRHVLFVVSDMWQETRELDASPKLCTQETMDVLGSKKLVANLRDSQVFALGVGGASHSKTDWMCLHSFWVQYFAKSGAILREYSTLRTVDWRMPRYTEHARHDSWPPEATPSQCVFRFLLRLLLQSSQVILVPCLCVRWEILELKQFVNGFQLLRERHVYERF
jgi:hypothetical protein